MINAQGDINTSLDTIADNPLPGMSKNIAVGLFLIMHFDRDSSRDCYFIRGNAFDLPAGSMVFGTSKRDAAAETEEGRFQFKLKRTMPHYVYVPSGTQIRTYDKGTDSFKPCETVNDIMIFYGSKGNMCLKVSRYPDKIESAKSLIMVK